MPTPGVTPPAPAFAEAKARAAALPATAEAGRLGEPDMRAILAAAGWEPGLIDAGLRVAWCESGWRPGAISGGGHRGLFQLEPGTWAPYAGVGGESLLDAATNARVAWLVVLYDRARGYPDFAQWSCQP